MWAISIDSSPRKRRIWRPLTKSLWWIWIRTSLQDSPFSIQSLCSMSEKNDYFGPSCILLHTHNYPRAFSHDFQKIIDIPFTISAIAEIIRIWSSVFFFLIFPEPKTKCFVNKTVMLSMLLYHSLSLFSYILLLDVVYNNSLLFLLLMRKAAIYDPLTVLVLHNTRSCAPLSPHRSKHTPTHITWPWLPMSHMIDSVYM